MSDSQSQSKKNKGGIPVVLAAISIQLTLGIAYLWSIFQRGITASIFEGDNAAAGLTFSLLLATLTVGSVIGGKLVTKFSTKTVVFIGGVILSLGFFSAAFIKPEYSWLLWVTYGIMGGTGMGFTYSTTIACAQKWYPHKRGLVTGIIVSALGFGGVVFTPVIEGLISFFGGEGVGEQKTFMVLAGVFITVCTIGSFFLKSPHGADAAAVAAAAPSTDCKSQTPGQMLKNPRFYIITLAFALACLGGLMVINYAKPYAIAKELAPNTAAIGVIAISLFNSGGRLVWGMVSDKLGRINTITILLGGSAILALCLNFAYGLLIFVVIALFGFFYGGFLSNFPSLVADIFGPKHLATNYGFVLLGFGSGAIAASQVAGYYMNRVAVANREYTESLGLNPDETMEYLAGNAGQMLPAFIIAASCAVVAIGLIMLIKVMNKKKD
jgi:OFA family oxalate/formate antiporter-like MFS transporter